MIEAATPKLEPVRVLRTAPLRRSSGQRA
jgi:hypothetical protein